MISSLVSTIERLYALLNKPKNLSGANFVWPVNMNEYSIVSLKPAIIYGRKVEFSVSEIVKDRAKSQVPFLYVQGIWLYPLPNLWRIGQIS